MATCQKINIPARIKVCAGDLRFKIVLYKRDLGAPDDVDFDITFTEQLTVKAGFVALRGSLNVNSTNLQNLPTHKFYIRYLGGINSSWIIELDGEYYKILPDGINPLDGRKFFLELQCVRRGVVTRRVNFV